MQGYINDVLTTLQLWNHKTLVILIWYGRNNVNICFMCVRTFSAFYTDITCRGKFQ